MQELEFLGCGGATNVEMGGNCAYLKHQNSLLLVDCCEDATKKLLDKNLFNQIGNIFIALTHMHFDHIAGIGTLIWFCNFRLNIKPKIIINSKTFKRKLIKLFKLGGVDLERVEFIPQIDFAFDDLTLEMKRTNHAEELECYGIMFKDNTGKYYYSGDTRDFENIKQLSLNEEIRTIYCEVSETSHGVHLCYDDIKTLNKEKFVLMHFNTKELYEQIVKDGYKVAKIEKEI